MTRTKFSTPMMKQYAEIKSHYDDCLLFFRMGDFYELFLEDAKVGAEILDITLTSRPKGRDGRIPMAGVPYHAVDNYIAKLVKAGYKVAICEQVSEPDKYGIVDREVIRVVTPGTVLDEKALDKKENNFLISLLVEEPFLSISSADVSTGLVQTTQIVFENLATSIQNELTKLNPAECILPPLHYNDPDILKILNAQKGMNIYCYNDWDDITKNSAEYLKQHFGIKTLDSFNMADKHLSLKTSAALLSYLKSTQKDKIGHITKIISPDSDEYLSLDRSTIINLELFSTIREHDTRGTLLSVLDQTLTAMGGRMMKDWMKRPLHDKAQINLRLECVEELITRSEKRRGFIQLLSEINDFERTLSRLSAGIGNARDLILLSESLKKVLTTKHKLVDIQSTLAQQIQESLRPDLAKVIQAIDTTILDEPSFSLKEGGLIKDGVNKKLDKLRTIVNQGKDYIVGIEKRERERTGISSLKVRFNQVFGFYIEVSHANVHLVPQDFMRKQTLVNAERFITPELKSQEEMILGAEEEIKKIEYEIYQKVLTSVLSHTKKIQQAAFGIACFDCLLSFATVSANNRYIRPKIIYSGEIKIKKGRHPVVEKLLGDMQFNPNDVELNNTKQQLLIITGPNMAGKSVYIRQVALIVLMAHMGCFVPAQSAHISLVDKIFVRSGASDVITSGLSTFMVEMVETAYILNHATKKSLIVMDEIGRGTSTYDGISLAWAVAEYLVKTAKQPPKVLFATHYHELQALEKEYPKHIKNYHLAVKEEDGEPIFLHTVTPGGASHSFGIAVAKLAGVPHAVVDRAYGILHSLEEREKVSKTNISKSQGAKRVSKLEKRLKLIDINNMTPISALTTLAELKETQSK